LNRYEELYHVFLIHDLFFFEKFMSNIAQVNIARMKGSSINDPIMADFVAQLDEINQLAERSKGFVWRLKEDGGNATEISYNEDPRIIINMSVWETLADLENFTYRTIHAKVMSLRKNWFEKMDHYQCLWYVHKEVKPTVEDAKFRLNHLQVNGPSPIAFTFRKTFLPEISNC
jgi:hypothetical protein